MGRGISGLFNNTKGGCFIAGTLILTEYGLEKIENIKTGDYVFSKNTETGEIGLKRVKETFINTVNNLMYLYCNNTMIVTTLEHPFWIHNKGWIFAEEIRENEFVTDKNKNIIFVDKVENVLLNEYINVFNFHVEDWHSYFVSDLSVLVHNSSNSKVNGSISDKTIKEINKKWGQKGVDAFEKAKNKGFVSAKGENGIKKLSGPGIKIGNKTYKYEIKVKNKEYGDYRIYGYENEKGEIIFDYFGRGKY